MRLPSGVRRVVFVCAGNICRSPIAEQAFRRARGALAREPLDVASLGLVAEDGDCPIEDTLRAAAAAGLDLSAHRARRFSESRMRSGDLACVMERSQAAAVAAVLSELGGHGEDRVRLLGAFRPLDGDPEIADPENGSPAVFDACVSRLVRCAEALVLALEGG